MSSNRTKLAVGLFITSGLAIILITIIWLGVTKVFEQGNYYVTYFNESVQGLNLDSQVKYRGVPVGRVETIGVAPDSKLIQVILKMIPDFTLQDNIVAQLKPVGITGSIFIELDRRLEGDAALITPITFPSKYPVIQSKSSTQTQILQGIEEVVTKLSKAIDDAQIPTLSKEVRQILAAVDTLVTNPKLDQIITNLEADSRGVQKILVSAQKNLRHAENILGRLDTLMTQNSDKITSAIDNAQQMSTSANILVKRSSTNLLSMERDLASVMQNLEEATRNLNGLLQTLEDHPSQLLFGDKPSGKSIE